MSEDPILSIVTPTRGNFTAYWLDQLLTVQGAVQFVLVYPPGASVKPIVDPRVLSIVSPYKGEVVQRLTGLLNATGKYVMALDDDDFVHPDVLSLVKAYFARFPQSWMLRLKLAKIDFRDEAEICKKWQPIPDIADQSLNLQPIPIAPLTHSFDWRYLVWPMLDRLDMHGPHIENFNNKIWCNDRVQPALADLSATMRLIGSLNWMPLWNLDRLLGLYVQAYSFEAGKPIGHWLPTPAQIRYIVMPQNLKREFRFMLPADALLVKRFPRYGYFWNLAFNQFWLALRQIGSRVIHALIARLLAFLTLPLRLLAFPKKPLNFGD